MDTSEYPLIDDLVAPSESQPAGAHVIDFEIQKILSKGWHAYLAVVREAAGTIPDAAAREITTSFEAECHGGDALKRGVRSLHRTRKAWTIEELLWNPSNDAVVARSKVVLLLIDRSTGKAAEIPANLWDAVEAFEGHAVPTVERPA